VPTLSADPDLACLLHAKDAGHLRNQLVSMADLMGFLNIRPDGY